VRWTRRSNRKWSAYGNNVYC